MSASGASAAPPSTMTMASFEHATIEIDVGRGLLLERRHRDELAVHSRDAHAGERPGPRDVGEVEGCARARESEGVGGVDLVGGEDGRDDLRIALVPLGKEGPHRAVDDAADEDLVVPLAPLALEEAARDLAGGERLLDVLAGEGEEVEAGALVARDGGDEDDALAVGDEEAPWACLARRPGLERQRLAVDQ